MSIASHHAEWLSLVETSGPFLSMPVLSRAFANGLEKYERDQITRLRESYEDWLERGTREVAAHRAWVLQVLTELLEYPADFLLEGQAIPPGLEAAEPQFGETLRPDWVLKRKDSESRAQLFISLYPPSQKLDGPVAGKVWKATPGTRMMELLHATEVPLGLVTNGEHWMLVYAPRGETTGFASWYADLWMQEPITLRAFFSLLHLRRFFGVAQDDTLPALYAASAKDQQEVTEQLGYQVRQAVEILVQALDSIDAESGRQLLAGVSEKDIYDSALTVMMRLVFLFSAEERALLLLGDALYDQHYAVSTLSALLREVADQHGEEILERRHDAWCRLLATFRAVYGGVQHEAMRVPAYGGTLFDPDRYPFLEGRTTGSTWRSAAAAPLKINNRVVLHLLEALQILRVRVPGGGPAEARRLSFRALDVEQIGHVYEGLLDHTAKRAGKVVLGLAGTRDLEPEIPLSILEEKYARGVETLVEFVSDETGRQTSTIRRALETKTVETPLALDLKSAENKRGKRRTRNREVVPVVDEHKLLIACGQDPLLVDKVKSFAALLRENSFGQFVVIPDGSVYVTRGSDRRSTGTHYTPRSLTEPIVQYTLEPLVYIGPAEGKPKEEWQLKSAKEILNLKICDMTMGSGAFLVQGCRYLGERLVEAWEIAEKANPGKILATPEGDFSEGDPRERLIPNDPAERLAIGRRYVADRCLYGVDINPMAVEMAKLSLWLITLQKDRPFTFLDHAFKCGDSLLGVSTLKQVENFSLRPGERQITFATANLFRYVDEASAKRCALEDLPSNDHTQIEIKNRLHTEAEAATAKVKALADTLIAFELRGLDGDAYETARDTEAENIQRLMKEDSDTSLKLLATSSKHLTQHGREQLPARRPFHWPVEFPEVIPLIWAVVKSGEL
jgi:Eco57I restriction-modification methylase